MLPHVRRSIRTSASSLAGARACSRRRFLVEGSQRRRPSCPRCSSFSSAAKETAKRPFDKVLIANRGEIACRIVRTCQKLGVRTVGLYSDADGPNALHASMSDECYKIGTGPSPSESYLRGEEVLEIAEKSGAQAIHPGYGFLSENPDFADLVSRSPSVTFVGPSSEAIRAMGSKSFSKKLMEDAGVPVTPGYHGSNQNPDALLQEAGRVGYPLLIKATAGGGGKGMRLVRAPSQFLDALESCKRESLKSFGNDDVILERYLVDPRHVEVQIVADSLGNVLHLHERDCSLQRRHQKIIEEAPASYLPSDVRTLMGETAKRAAKAVNYVNAGTVEFLLEKSDPTQFYFCEMNTRLQVEHPITELITGIDLVEWQLNIAAGEPLPIRDQSDVPCVGHAMEARIYAENPSKDFLPSTGTVRRHDPPVEPNVGVVSPTGVRVDSGIRAGDDVGVHYDPMISKLIVHDVDRASALKKLIKSLKSYKMVGLVTNVPFLVECARHPVFETAGNVTTGFLDERGDEVNVTDRESPGPTALAVGAFVVLMHLERRIGLKEDVEASRRQVGPWSNLMGSWRMGSKGCRLKRTLIPANDEEGGNWSVDCYANRDGSFEIAVNDASAADNDDDDDRGPIARYTVRGTVDPDGSASVSIESDNDGARTKRFFPAAIVDETSDDDEILCVDVWSSPDDDDDCDGSGETPYAWHLEFRHPLRATADPTSSGIAAGGAGHGKVKSPMPGKIVRIATAVGQTVQRGDALFVMEAMKMEHAVASPMDGIVEEVADCTEGDVVDDGRVLAIVRASSDGD